MRKTLLLVSASILSILFLTTCGGGGGGGSKGGTVSDATDISGNWNGTWATSIGTNSGIISTSITHSGTSFSGTINISGSPCISSGTFSGTASGGFFSASVVSGQNAITFEGTYTATLISGTYSVPSGACAGDSGTFSLQKTQPPVISNQPPVISNLQYSPQSADLNEGGGNITVTGTVNFSDEDGNVSSYILTISDSDGNVVDTLTDTISGAEGVTSGVLNLTVTVSTTTADNYSLSIYLTDSTWAQSNTLTGTFIVFIPLSDAGSDQAVLIGSLATLDGSASSDPEGAALTYRWSFKSFPAGSSAALTNSTVVGPSFTADLPGTYVISLVVNNGMNDSPPDTVNVTAITPISSNLPDTGQNKCYNDSTEINCPSQGEAFYGQDFQYSTNPMSFTDNGDNTVTGNITGLMWQKEDDGLTYNWYEASGTYDATYNPTTTDVCGSLILGGYADWRLPTSRELVSIVDYGTYYPAIDTTYFPNTGPSDYWSSTTIGTSLPYSVDFNDGGVSKLYKPLSYNVRCVRGQEWGRNNFTDDGNGTVMDDTTGLMWQQDDDGVTRNWETALSYCEELLLAGHSDWRLPDAKELGSITDVTWYQPSIDTTYFPTAKSSTYWSSTASADPLFDVWSVFFNNGVVAGHGYTYINYVRCVR